MWKSIENDFVISAACLLHVAKFVRAAKYFGKPHGHTSYLQGTHLSFVS